MGEHFRLRKQKSKDRGSGVSGVFKKQLPKLVGKGRRRGRGGWKVVLCGFPSQPK